MKLRLSATLFLASMAAACTGADGADGTDGSDGMDGSIIQTSMEPAGTNCANGGTKVEIGHDVDKDGMLSGAEVDQTVYVCNGAPGSPGTSGRQSLINVTAEPPGANCAAGGQKIEHGIDDDNNGTLDQGEVDGTAYVCDGADGLHSLVVTAPEPEGPNCTFGGTKVMSGIDDNDNGVLEEGEVDSTAYVCQQRMTLFLSQDSNPNGLYRVSPTTGRATFVGISGVIGATVGLAYDPVEQVLLGSKWLGLMAINPDGSGSVDRGGEGAEALAYDYVNDVVYGAINGTFFSMSKTNGALIASLPEPGFDAEGLAFRADTGTIYAVGGSNNALHAYSIADDQWSVVGTHGLDLDNAGLAYDSWDNVLYATGGSNGNLYRINPSTGAATLVGATGLGNANGGLAMAVVQ